MDAAKLFAVVRSRPFDGALSQEAVDGINAILPAFETYGDGDTRKLAYILATAFHEADRFRTMEEYASGSAYEGRKDLGNVQKGDGRRFKGRGFVQLTGRRNYADWSERLGIDLVGDPDIVTQPAIAARILVQGMMLGTFTGKGLPDYINASKSDYTNARRVVNGTDKAALIAGYTRSFFEALLAADFDTEAVPVVLTAQPDAVLPAPQQPADAPQRPPATYPAPTPVEQSAKAIGAGKWAGLAAGIWQAIVLAGVLPPPYDSTEFSSAVMGLIVTVAAIVGSYRAPRNAEPVA